LANELHFQKKKHFQTRNAWLNPACGPPGTNAPAKLKQVTRSKFNEFLLDVEVLTRTFMFQLWNARTHSEGGVCQKSVTIATSFSDCEKKVRLIIPTHNVYLS